MSLGKQIADHIEAQGLQQRVVALEFVAAWREENNGSTLSNEGTASRLSDLCKDKLAGTKYFFRDPERQACFRKALGAVPDAVWVAWVELAGKQIDTSRDPDVVVDLSTLAVRAEQHGACYKEIRAWLDDRPGWNDLAVTFVIAQDQFDDLPRSYDGLNPRVAVEKVPTIAAGVEKVEQLAGDQALPVRPAEGPSDGPAPSVWPRDDGALLPPRSLVGRRNRYPQPARSRAEAAREALR